jgi:hypothetical protein
MHNYSVFSRDFQMRRKKLEPRKNSTHTAPSPRQFDAEHAFRALEKRVDQLEKAVWYETGSLEGLPTAQNKEPKRPGPKGIHFEMLLGNRNDLLQMLETYWPEIEPFCLPKPNTEGLRRVLAAIANRGQERYRTQASHLLRRVPDLVEFLITDRFRRDPRQIANAFAEFPKVGIWRSLKLCQSSPCDYPIGERAIKAYICRRHSRFYERLSADYSLTNFVNAIRSYRTKDQKLKSFPLQAWYLFEAWKKCAPDYAAIGLIQTEKRKK